VRRILLTLWAGFAVPTLPAQAQSPRELLLQYCGDCHSGDDAERGLRLDLVGSGQADANALPADELALALQRLASQTMPPPKAAAPSADERRRLRQWLAGLLPVDAERERPVARRLSRREFERSIAALFGLAIDGGELLPEDTPGHGFANLGDAACATPLAVEKYYAAAVAIAGAIDADPAVRARFGTSEQQWTELLPTLLAKAFRRPIEASDIAPRRNLHRELLAAGKDLAAADRALLQSVLLSPHFLFRLERGDPQRPGQLDSHSIAVRLAYFLTGAPPDEALTQLASDGTLQQPAVRRVTVRRLLANDDGRSLATGFFAEWLGLDDALAANADFRRYPQIWQQELRPHFREEALLLVQAMLRDDLPITTLVDADFSYLSAALARHYGLPSPDTAGFARVALTDRRRGGLLGMGAMLLPTSTPLRTSPVQRGRWILDRLLAAAMPPAPPGVGALPADDAPKGTQTLRQRLEHHRRHRSCASCHAVMDPLGFALENYDVMGGWRDELHGQPIDSRGELPSGQVLAGPVALKDALLQRRDELVYAMAKNLLTYATGRAFDMHDDAELLALVAESATGGHRMLALLEAVVTSPSFTRWPETGMPR